MSIVEISPIEEPPAAESDVVELVTLKPEQVAEGSVSGHPHPFPDIASALRYARESLSEEERSLSWIRTATSTIRLDQAEAAQHSAPQS
jgi:hypothetical protein